MGQVSIAPFRFLCSELPLGPTSYEDRALPKMLRRAVEFAAAMCLPAATSTLVKGGKCRERMSGRGGQIPGNWRPWTGSTQSPRPLCSKSPFP